MLFYIAPIAVPYLIGLVLLARTRVEVIERSVHRV